MDKKGWAITYLSDSLKELIKESEIEDVFNCSRMVAEKVEKEKKPVNKYVCGCGIVMKSTKELDIICGKCMERFEVEE